MPTNPDPAPAAENPAPVPTPAPVPIDAATLVSPLAESMPEVTANKSKDPAPTTPTDSNGRPFQPGYHATHEDGSPKTDKVGRFYPRTAGRPPKQGSKPPKVSRAVNRPPPQFANVGQGSAPETTESSPAPTPQTSPGTVGIVSGDQRFELMAESYLRLSYAPIVAVLGTEAQPDEDEHAALKIATVPVLKKYDADDLHPLVGLAAVAIGVGLAKAQKPTVRERFSALVARFRRK